VAALDAWTGAAERPATAHPLLWPRQGPESFKRAFEEVQRWKAPHPPGTYLNFHPDTRLEVIDSHTVRMVFPEPDGLVLGKFRGFHLPSTRFWDEEGFGYRKRGSGEGHW
jgi:hypothetical protein